MGKEVRIEVRSKEEFYDAVAVKVMRDVKDLGGKGVTGIDFIELYEISGKVSERNIKRIARDLLADKVAQEYCYGKGFTLNKKKKPHVVEIAYNPGVMDPVRESALKAIADMGIAVDDVRTSKKYIIYGDISEKSVQNIADRLLYNKIIQHRVIQGRKTEIPFKLRIYTSGS